MRKLGLIGGMSWVSTRTYYTHINTIVQAKAGRHSSAPLLIESLDFAQLYAIRDQEGWERAAATFVVLDRALAAFHLLGSMVQVHVDRCVPIGGAGVRLEPLNPVFVCWGDKP